MHPYFIWCYDGKILAFVGQPELPPWTDLADRYPHLIYFYAAVAPVAVEV